MFRNQLSHYVAVSALSRSAVVFVATLVVILLSACAARSSPPSFPVTATSGLDLTGIVKTQAKAIQPNDLSAALSSVWSEPLDLDISGAGQDASSVDSCTALIHAIYSKPSVEPANLSETPFYLYRANICLAIQALSEATPSKISFVRSFQLNATALDLLPAELAFALSGEDLEHIKNYRGQTLKTLFRTSNRFDLKDFEVLNSYSARLIDSNGGRQEMTILGYGDFNADGSEDLLLLVQDSIANASYAASTLYQLTRANEGPLRVLHEYALLQRER